MAAERTSSSRYFGRFLFLVAVGLLVWRIGLNFRHNQLNRQLFAAVLKVRNDSNHAMVVQATRTEEGSEIAKRLDQEVSEVAKLLDQGADPLAKEVRPQSGDSTTALQIADYPGTPAATHLLDLLLAHTQSIAPRSEEGTNLLFFAAQAGRTEIVQRLLDQGANIEADVRGFTLLDAALLGGHVATVRLLLDRGAGKDYLKSDRFRERLGYVNHETLRLLIERGIDPNITVYDGTPLLLKVVEDTDRETVYYATPLLLKVVEDTDREDDDVATVRLLLQHGANVNSVKPINPTTLGNRTAGQSALLAAIASGNLGIARLLIDVGADVNRADSWGETPLMAATESDLVWVQYPRDGKPLDLYTRAALLRERGRARVDLIESLIAHGANINAMDRSGLTPLVYALANSQPGIANLLLAHGAGVNVVAAAAGRVSATGLRLLIAHGAHLNAKDPAGNTALINAAISRRLDTMELLLTGGATIDEPDADGNTALMRAIGTSETMMEQSTARENVVRLLLARGANVNARNRRGVTPLMLAAGTANVGTDIVQWLLDRGADPQAQDDLGKNALFYAAQNGHTDTLKLLLSKGVNINSRDKRGETPLIAMLKTTAPINQTLMLLISSGGDVNARDAEGQTPLAIALQNRHTRAADLLRQAGAAN